MPPVRERPRRSITHTTRTARLARRLALPGPATAAVLLPLGTGTAQAASAASAPSEALPPGALKLRDGEPRPPQTLCLYRDYGLHGPRYGIRYGYDVDLRRPRWKAASTARALPMKRLRGSTGATPPLFSWTTTRRGLARSSRASTSRTPGHERHRGIRPLAGGPEVSEAPPCRNFPGHRRTSHHQTRRRRRGRLFAT